VILLAYFDVLPRLFATVFGQAVDFLNIGLNDAVVLIGDQCFEFESRFRYKTDLAMEWKKFSGLPFVFACWTSNRLLDEVFIQDFNKALRSGVTNIDAVVNGIGKTGTITGEILKIYLTENIDYDFNSEKKKGLKFSSKAPLNS